MIFFNDYLRLFEGGNIFKDAESFDGERVGELVSSITEFMEDKLGFSKSDYAFVGSIKHKGEGNAVNDIDVAVSVKSDLLNSNVTTMEESYEVLDKLSNICNKKKVENEIRKTLGLVSCKIKVDDGKYLQTDLLVVPSVVWGKWSYYSPRYSESKYKGLYRNALFEAIAKSVHFDIEYYTESEETEHIKKGDIKSYYRYRYFRNLGLWKVKEYNTGVRVLKYSKDYDTYKLVTHKPESVINILLGDYDINKSYTFEDVYSHITKKSYKHNDLLDTILENFRIVIVDRQGNELPSEVDYLKSKK